MGFNVCLGIVRTIRVVIVFLAFHLGCLTCISKAAAVIDPALSIEGKTQLDHAHLWWQTMLNISATNNPLLDPTGDDAGLAKIGNVLYVAGSFDPSSSRSITISADTKLFFPLLNTYIDNTNFFGLAPFNDSPQDLASFIALPPSEVTLFLEVDGVPVAQLTNFRQQTDPANPFSTVISSPDNLLVASGLDPTLGTANPFDPASYPTVITPAMVDGYWIGMDSFMGGETFTLRFGGNAPQLGFSQNNFLAVTVAVPEPSSFLLCGLVAVIATRRRKSHRAN